MILCDVGVQVEGGRRLGSRPFRPLSLLGTPPAGNPRSVECGLRVGAPRARDGLFRFGQVRRGPGPARRVLVFWEAPVSGRRGERTVYCLTGLGGRGCSHCGGRWRRSRGNCAGSRFHATAGGRRPFPSPSSESCTLQAGWPGRRLPRSPVPVSVRWGGVSYFPFGGGGVRV